MTNKIVGCLFFLSCVSFAIGMPIPRESSPEWSAFEEFKLQFNKTYESLEETYQRFEIFKENFLYVMEENTLNHGYKLKINKFADLTNEEFKLKMTGFIVKKSEIETKLGFKNQECSEFESNPNITIPDSLDWRNKSVVTPIKNQQQCGSCWSFSATGAMEGACAIKTGKLISLSEQELVDCSGSYGNMGCNGGLMDSAFEYAIDNGMCAEDDYPYIASDSTCKKCDAKIHISGCVDVPTEDPEALKQAVAQGPVSVAIEADRSFFQLYSHGVLDNILCGTNLDHGVLVVGYGTENGKDYWLVKNSWGTSWGDEGYIKIKRDDKKGKGICGINMQPSFPTC